MDLRGIYPSSLRWWLIICMYKSDLLEGWGAHRCAKARKVNLLAFSIRGMDRSQSGDLALGFRTEVFRDIHRSTKQEEM